MTFRHPLLLALCLALGALLAAAPAAQAQQQLILQEVGEYEYARHVHSRTVVRVTRSGEWKIDTVFRNANDQVNGTISVQTRVFSPEGRCLFGTSQEVELERTASGFANRKLLEKQGKIPRRLARFVDRVEFQTQLIPAGTQDILDGLNTTNIVLENDRCDLGNRQTAERPKGERPSRGRLSAIQVPTTLYVVSP